MGDNEEDEIVDEGEEERALQEYLKLIKLEGFKKENEDKLIARFVEFFNEHKIKASKEEVLAELNRLLAEMKRLESKNYFEKNESIEVLIIETQGGAGHIQAAKRKKQDVMKREEDRLEESMVETISVLQDPTSEKESWMKLAFVDIGKGVIKDWNEKQKKGEMGSLTSLAMFQYQVRLGERIFGKKAGKKAFTTFTARPNMKEIYDTQNIFTPHFARAVNRYVEIKKSEEKCRAHNRLVGFNSFLRQMPLLRGLSSDLYLHEIEHDPDFKLSYTKVMTDLPTKGEDFFVSLRLMKKKDLENFYLEVPHAAPLSDKIYDVKNRENLKRVLRNLSGKYPDEGFDELLKDIVRGDDEIIDYSELYNYLNDENNIDKRRLYDIAYYVMQCPNLIDLAPDHFKFTIGPIRSAFEKKHEERKSPKEKSDVKITFGRSQAEKDKESNQLFIDATGIDIDIGADKKSTIEIPKDAEVEAIMLGSQASQKTLTYIDEYIEALKDSDKEHYLFVFTGNHFPASRESDGSMKQSLYEKVCNRIKEKQPLEKIHIIPLENQDEHMIAQTFSVADEVLIRTGGLSSMEVEAVCKEGCRIFIHSEVEEDRRSFSSEEDFEEVCFEKMLPWEEGNALHIQASRKDCSVKIVNTTSLNTIREQVLLENRDPSQVQDRDVALNLTNKKVLIKLIYAYQTDKDKERFETIVDFINDESVFPSTLSLKELRRLLDELVFSKLTEDERNVIENLGKGPVKDFLNDKILEDVLLSEARKVMVDKPKSKTMQDLNYQLSLLRRRGEEVNLKSAAANAVADYKGSDLNAYKKSLLKYCEGLLEYCPSNSKDDVRKAMDRKTPNLFFKKLDSKASSRGEGEFQKKLNTLTYSTGSLDKLKTYFQKDKSKIYAEGKYKDYGYKNKKFDHFEEAIKFKVLLKLDGEDKAHTAYAYKAESSPDVIFAMEKISELEVQEKVIEAICVVAVAQAEPNTVFNLDKTPAEIKSIVEAALKKAIKEREKAEGVTLNMEIKGGGTPQALFEMKRKF